MRIKRITIKNFRSFDEGGIEITIPDIKRPISIVGYNNSGKSNLINAILSGLGQASNNFSENDFYCKRTDKPFLVEIEVTDPLMSTGAYNNVKEMPIFQLEVKDESGVIESSHYFCEKDGEKVKKIFNVRSTKRSPSKTYTEKEEKILNEYSKTGAEMVWKWKSDVPLYFIDSVSIEKQLIISNYTLLGNVIREVRKSFESKENVLEERDGIVKSHVGKTRKDVFNNAIEYLENYVLSTKDFEELVKVIEKVIKSQLEIEGEDFKLKFGFPSADTLFNNLEFYLTDNPEKPKLPIKSMGRGFISLFVVALLRVITDSDEGGKIFIFEEPESFLHEHFQEYFYQILCKLAEKNQVIFTTHSKKFIDVFEPQSIVRVRNNDFLKSDIIHPARKLNFPVEIDEFKITNPEDFPKYLKSLEPNIGNILFSSKVLIVEGPHDVLAYKTVFQDLVNFGLKNISLIAAWGKDSLLTIIDICELFEIEFFVIHDWDLDTDLNPNTLPTGKTTEEKQRLASAKQQWTKNEKILSKIKNENLRHCNKKNLESVLGIERNRKGTIAIYEKLKGKRLNEVMSEFPDLISDNLLNFLQIDLKLAHTKSE